MDGDPVGRPQADGAGEQRGAGGPFDLLEQPEPVGRRRIAGRAWQHQLPVPHRPAHIGAGRADAAVTAPQGAVGVVADAAGDPLQVARLAQIAERRRIAGLRAAPSGTESAPVLLEVVDRHAVGALAAQSVGQGSVVFRRRRRAEALIRRAVGLDAGVEPARRPGGESGELLVGGVEVRERRVHGRHEVDQPAADPGRHVQPHGLAVVQGLRHQRAQFQPPPARAAPSARVAPSARGALLVEQGAQPLDQAGHQVLPLARQPPVAVGGGKVEPVAEGEVHAVDVEPRHHLGDDLEQVVAHLGDRVVHPVARQEGAAGRHVGELPLRVPVQEHAALIGGAVVVVDPEAGQEAHAARPGAILHHLQRHDAVVHHRQEPPVLRARVVLEALGAEVHDPAGVVDLLHERVGVAGGDVVDEGGELLRRGRMPGDQGPRVAGIEVIVGHVGRIADVDQLPVPRRSGVGGRRGGHRQASGDQASGDQVVAWMPSSRAPAHRVSTRPSRSVTELVRASMGW